MTDRRFRIMQLESIARLWDEKAAAAEADDEPWAPQYRQAAERAAKRLEEARAAH
jgi:hypothetical protein